MATGLEGRVALVTGGGRGVGAAVCVALAEDGADVVVNYRRSADEANEVAAACEKLGRRAIALQADVADGDATQAMVEQAVAEFGKINVLVHNAGLASRPNLVSDTPREEVQRILDCHAIGPHQLTRWVLPHMRGQGRGDIVFVSSIATRHHQAYGAPYSMGKAAMESLAFTLAKEERKHDIHVNVVAPGLIDTEMGKRLVKSWGADIDQMDPQSPFGRVCQPEDVAGVVRYFCSDHAGYLTGERVYLDGGGVTPP
jgi:NAD(P)-dependent dehydrogenase (short-subunit alcohol dehydrogenase family)